MTESNSLDCLKKAKRTNDMVCILPNSDIGECIIKALEKQIPKEVISFEYEDGHINYGCPVCKRKMISKINGEWCVGQFNDYCDRCGQKLDWSDVV